VNVLLATAAPNMRLAEPMLCCAMLYVPCRHAAVCPLTCAVLRSLCMQCALLRQFMSRHSAKRVSARNSVRAEHLCCAC
jgi:hypothetical protein